MDDQETQRTLEQCGGGEKLPPFEIPAEGIIDGDSDSFIYLPEILELKSSMTTIIGAFSDDAMDIVIASDRQRSAKDTLTGKSWLVEELKTKSIRINDDCCMACAGETIYANQVYAYLFGKSEWDGHQPNLDVAKIWNDGGFECIDIDVLQALESLDRFGQQHKAQLDDLGDTSINILLAGSANKRNPVLYVWAKGTEWKCRERSRQPEYITPLIGEEREEFDRILKKPGTQLHIRVMEAMHYASLHSASTNEHVTLRWWSEGFDAEQVIVSAKPSSSSATPNP